jgi:hypothetical protein
LVGAASFIRSNIAEHQLAKPRLFTPVIAKHWLEQLHLSIPVLQNINWQNLDYSLQ